jgi:hypothetical protein
MKNFFKTVLAIFLFVFAYSCKEEAQVTVDSLKDCHFPYDTLNGSETKTVNPHFDQKVSPDGEKLAFFGFDCKIL